MSDLENIMLCEKLEKINVRFHLYELRKVVKFMETGSRMVVTRSQGEGGKESCLMNITVSNLQDGKVLKLCFSTMSINTTVHLKMVMLAFMLYVNNKIYKLV